MIELKLESEIEDFTKKVFKEIESKKTCEELVTIIDNSVTLSKYKLPTDKYPPIKFSVTLEEKEQLKKLFDKDGKFSENIYYESEGVLSKLLYAMAWKNGDLPKLKHIVNGVLHSGKDSIEQETGLVFYQFGKHLINPSIEPIVDQHVLRAFAVENKQFVVSNKSTYSPREQKILIDKYKEWLGSSKIQQELRKEANYMYYIDQVLFATGKAIKNLNARLKHI